MAKRAATNDGQRSDPPTGDWLESALVFLAAAACLVALGVAAVELAGLWFL